MKKIQSHKNLVRDFLDGRLDAKQRSLFLIYMKQSEDVKKLSEIHESLFDQIQKLSTADVQQLYALLKKEQNKNSVFPIWRKLLPYAAAILCVLAGAIYFAKRTEKVYNPIAVKNNKPARRSVTLPDSSIVILESDAAISQIDFNSKERHLKLTGTAFFKVRSNATPFLVLTQDGYQTRVLGTEFRVTSDKNLFQVAVEKGRVFVSKSAKELAILQKGDDLKVVDNRITIHSSLKNSLDFNNRTLGEIIKGLNESYDTDIVLADGVDSSVKSRVSFDKKLSVYDAITLLCEINGLTYRLENNQIKLARNL